MEIKTNFFRYLGLNSGVAALYFATGYLGLHLLSIGPGYATPIWIPSGIALGAALIWGRQVLPGVFLGSLLINVLVSAHPQSNEFYFPLLIACIIATGALLQTLLGWYLIKKWVGLDNSLNYPNDILLFAFLSGPLSCLFNTTWSNTLLYFLKVLRLQDYPSTWIAWWVGDSIGVLIFTPLFLILFAQPYSLWHKRIVPILIPLCFSFVGVMLLCFLVSRTGNQTQIWFTMLVGLLFCVLINMVLFIVQGQSTIAQMQLQSQASKLKFEETKNLSILLSAGEGIFGVDTKGNTTFVNPAALKMLGYAEEELIGQPIHDLILHKHVDGTVYPRKNSPIYAAYRHNKRYQVHDGAFWRRNGSYFPVNYICTPLIDRNKTIGAVVVFNDVTQQREIEFALQKMAHYDLLTGLPNRASFLNKLLEFLEKARESQNIIAICFVDIDNFKQINDSMGHSVGDEILKAVPALIESELTKMDFIARLGGDEFAIILPNVSSADYIALTLQRILANLDKPIKLGRSEIITTLSIGVATYPLAGTTSEELIRNADIAMYKAKELGKNTYAFFDEEVSKSVQRMNALDLEMRRAFERQEFTLMYQPFVDTFTQNRLGFEVLVRWHSPTLGDISPSEFVPLAEKNGLIHQLGEWVLTRACLDYKKITSQFSDKNLLLSVNISVLQLEIEKFLPIINNILSETKMENNNLIFEITERGLMQQPDQIIKVMKDIKKLGIRFALDDFGVSYSSMQYLKILPISLLKIDKIFIANMVHDAHEAAIVRAIIQLAHALGISTIAEGVETQGQYLLLEEMKSEYIQGYYFAKPMTLEKLLLEQKNTLP